jgi:hypothetical protein
MGDCIPVRPWHDSPIECLAEVRMIWRDKSEQTYLLSLRLYFLPENTSRGRVNHGEVIFFLKFSCSLSYQIVTSSSKTPFVIYFIYCKLFF